MTFKTFKLQLTPSTSGSVCARYRVLVVELRVARDRRCATVNLSFRGAAETFRCVDAAQITRLVAFMEQASHLNAQCSVAGFVDEYGRSRATDFTIVELNGRQFQALCFNR